MSNSWKEVSLSDVCAKPQYGAIASGRQEPVGPPFVRQTDIVSGEIAWSSVPFCDLAAKDFEKYALRAGDILISRLGAGVGTAATVREPRGAVYAGYLVRFQTRPELADPAYVGYQLQSAAWRAHVSGFRSGAAQPTLNAVQMGAFRFRLPPLAEQQRIAEVLGALDDLIATNSRQIEQLLMAADLSYQLWLGSVGESVTTDFAAICDVFGGGTPSTKTEGFWGGDIRWATPTDVTALPSPYLFETTRHLTTEGLAACSSQLYNEGSILMTSRATIGAFALAQRPTAVNQGFIVVVPRAEQDRFVLMHEMRSRVGEFISQANGSTFLELSRGRFKSLPVTWPSLEDRIRFHSTVEPLHEAAAHLQIEIEELTAIRDQLLPLLMSGKLRVRELAA